MVSALRDEQSDPLLEDFAAILLTDVAATLQRYDRDQSQPARRDLIRTVFTAIEGYTWLYREHIIEAARSMDALDLREEIALSEVGYQVDERGKIVDQPRYLSMLAAFRLTTRIASRISPELSVRFDDGDWDRFRTAIGIRNRLTHPKRQADLEISDRDLASVQGAFYWLLNTVMGAMEAANAALRRYNTDFRAILSGLRDGNPDIWAEYIAAGRDT